MRRRKRPHGVTVGESIDGDGVEHVLLHAAASREHTPRVELVNDPAVGVDGVKPDFIRLLNTQPTLSISTIQWCNQMAWRV